MQFSLNFYFSIEKLSLFPWGRILKILNEKSPSSYKSKFDYIKFWGTLDKYMLKNFYKKLFLKNIIFSWEKVTAFQGCLILVRSPGSLQKIWGS